MGWDPRSQVDTDLDLFRAIDKFSPGDRVTGEKWPCHVLRSSDARAALIWSRVQPRSALSPAERSPIKVPACILLTFDSPLPLTETTLLPRTSSAVVVQRFSRSVAGGQSNIAEELKLAVELQAIDAP